MIALTRVCSIVHLAISLPIRWLAASSHTLVAHNWSVRSMGRAFDILENSLDQNIKDKSLFLNKNFMMGILNILYDELPSFLDHFTHMYENKKTKLIAQNQSKVVPFAQLRKELFHPTCNTNKSTDKITRDLGLMAPSSLLRELRDETKATANHLSSLEGRFNWEKISVENHKSGLGKIAVNDLAESSFGGTTR